MGALGSSGRPEIAGEVEERSQGSFADCKLQHLTPQARLEEKASLIPIARTGDHG